jgi:hypothetical protein
VEHLDGFHAVAVDANVSARGGLTSYTGVLVKQATLGGNALIAWTGACCEVRHGAGYHIHLPRRATITEHKALPGIRNESQMRIPETFFKVVLRYLHRPR